MDDISFRKDGFQFQRLQPIKACQHFKKLVADKEQTEHVFHIIKALEGNSQRRQYKRFMASDLGRQRLAQNRYLPPLLDDHQTLRHYEKGSLADHYVNFMEREGLTAQGLVDEFDRFDDQIMRRYSETVRWYFHRRRDTHDMLHVLTGYGRDVLGEACLLAFSYALYRGLGIAFIAIGAGLELRKSVPKDVKVMRAIYEGYRLGKAAQDIIRYDIVELLQQPIGEVRMTLNFAVPHKYNQALTQMRDHGLDPYQLIAPQAPMSGDNTPLFAP